MTTVFQPLRTVSTAVLFMLVMTASARAQVLEAVADTLSATTSGTTFFPTDLLQANDVVDATDSLRFDVVSGPLNGTLERQSDGSYRYTPRSGFVGEDRFTYRWVSIPIQRLVVDPAVSVLSFDATLQTDLGASDDTEQIPVEGIIEAFIGHDAAQIDSVHVVGLNLVNSGDHSLRFEYGSPITIASLRIRTVVGAVRLLMLEPGPLSETTGILNAWEQRDNVVDVSVTASLDGSGLFSTAVPDEDQELNTQTSEGLSGAVFLSGQQVLFLLTVRSTNTFDLDGNSVDLAIDGSLQANATFIPSRQSNAADVVVNVVSGAAVEGLERGVSSRVALFPHPVAEAFTLKWEAGRDPGPFTIQVFDMLGRRVASSVGAAHRGNNEMFARLDASNWPPGVYVVRIAGRTSNAVRTFVRQ